MPVTHSDFLSFSEELFESNQLEIGFRAAISRSYYAAYHRCGDLINQLNIESHGGIREGSGVHKIRYSLLMLITIYSIKNKHLDDKTKDRIRLIGQSLQNVCAERALADYELEEEITSNRALVHIENVKLLLADCEDLIN